MAQEKNTFLRIFVPTLVIVSAIGLFVAIISRPAQQTPTPNTPPGTVQGTSAGAPANQPANAAGNAPSQPAGNVAAGEQPAAAQPAGQPAALVSAGKLLPRIWPEGSVTDEAKFATLGATINDPALSAYRMQVAFSAHGAGIQTLKLALQRVGIAKDSDPDVLQQTASVQIPLYQNGVKAGVNEQLLVPMSILGVTVNGQYVDLFADARGAVWRETAPGAFEAEILDDSGAAVARVERRYSLKPGAYELGVMQRVVNLSAEPLDVVWRQLGPIDLPIGIIRYGGDVRRVRLGYLLGPTVDPEAQFVMADTRYLLPHTGMVENQVFDPARGTWVWPEKGIWPDKNTATEKLTLSWAALTNRYFAVAIHPAERTMASPTTQNPVPDKRFSLAATLDRVVLDRTADANADRTKIAHDAAVALRITSALTRVAPGQTLDTSVGVYAGPNAAKYMNDGAWLSGLNIPDLMLFTFGGPCGFCTFQWLAHFLHWFLGFLHDYVVFDWAIGIIFLVVCVRTTLHPVTRWSQTSLQKFSKQMAALAPKQAKIKEKFGHDQAQMREELAKLMKEEKVNYSGALGCLPMFMQTPVWIALSAMIYFAFELRHEGAFFGVFQKMGGWVFLGDLSEPDKFIPFGTSFHIPLISGLMGPIESINILPLLLGVVFFLQQKYMTPPAATQLTPEQEQQQKIMKVMMVVMFPLMMYNAPAALALYFMANSSLGILESRWIRHSIENAPALATAPAGAGQPMAAKRRGGPAAPEPAPGFFARMRNAVEKAQIQAQSQADQKRKLREPRRGKP